MVDIAEGLHAPPSVRRLDVIVGLEFIRKNQQVTERFLYVLHDLIVKGLCVRHWHFRQCREDRARELMGRIVYQLAATIAGSNGWRLDASEQRLHAITGDVRGGGGAVLGQPGFRPYRRGG